MATVSTRGVLADEKRRVAVRQVRGGEEAADGRERASGGPSSAGGHAGHDRSQEADRHHEEQIAVISDVAAAVSGACWWSSRR